MGTLAGQRLTIPQIYDYAVQAGFPKGLWAALMTATTMTESGGYTEAVSSTGASGLTQVIHGNYSSMGYTQQDMFDPLKNMRAAHQLWSNRGGASVSESQAFADWWPYDGGPSNPNWARYLTAATSAASGVDAGVSAGVDAAAPSSGGAGGLGGGVLDSSTFAAIQDFVAGGLPANEAQGDVKTITGGKLSDAASAAIASVSGVVSWLKTPVADLQKFVEGLLWLVNPANWVRIGAAVAGGILVLLGAVLLARSA